MIEMLITVLIISILLMFAIPAISNFQNTLKMRQLDDISRQIFISVQNQLTTMKSTGALPSLENKLSADYSGNKLTSPHYDYPRGDDTWTRLY